MGAITKPLSQQTPHSNEKSVRRQDLPEVGSGEDEERHIDTNVISGVRYRDESNRHDTEITGPGFRVVAACFYQVPQAQGQGQQSQESNPTLWYRESGKSGHQAHNSDDCEAQILACHNAPWWNAAGEKKSQEKSIVNVCDGESHHTAG